MRKPPLPQAGEGVLRGPLSRVRERAGVRVFTRRTSFISQEAQRKLSDAENTILLISPSILCGGESHFTHSNWQPP